MNFILQPWPWYVAGPLIALSMFLMFYFGKKFGVSSNLETLCSIAGAGKLVDFFKFDWRKNKWNLAFVFGLIIGGFIANQWLTPDQSIALNPKTVENLAEIGFEMYQKILAEAVRELKRSDFKELFVEEISKQDDYVQECTIDTDLEIMIPDVYVESIGERLSLYTRLDQTADDAELETLKLELIDRFGPMPKQVAALFTTIQSRRVAIALGFEKMTLKDETLRCFFINRPDSPYYESAIFKGLLSYTQTAMNNAHFKQVGKTFILIIKDIKSMEHCFATLTKIHHGVVGVEA